MYKKLLSLSFIILFLSSASIFAQDKNEKVPKSISGRVINGKAVSLPQPEYPVEAREAKISGSVKVQVVIDRAGNIMSAQAVSGHPLLKDAAVAAAKMAKFQPTLLEGSPVEVSGFIVYNFFDSEKTKSQLAKEKSEEEFEKELSPFAFTLLIAFYDNAGNVPEVSEMFYEMFDDMFDALTKSEPDAPKINGKFSQISKEHQRKTFDDVKNYLNETLNSPSTHWKFQMGEAFGNIIGNAVSQIKNGKDLPLNETELRTNLTTINNLMLKVPSTFPKRLSVMLIQVGNFSTRNDLGSREVQFEVIKLSMEIFEEICSD